MGNLNNEQQLYLEETFGPRATFDATERKFYGHDIAAMPSLFTLLIGDTAPA